MAFKKPAYDLGTLVFWRSIPVLTESWRSLSWSPCMKNSWEIFWLQLWWRSHSFAACPISAHFKVIRSIWILSSQSLSSLACDFNIVLKFPSSSKCFNMSVANINEIVIFLKRCHSSYEVFSKIFWLAICSSWKVIEVCIYSSTLKPNPYHNS